MTCLDEFVCEKMKGAAPLFGYYKNSAKHSYSFDKNLISSINF
jgi:hypothetical protein